MRRFQGHISQAVHAFMYRFRRVISIILTNNDKFCRVRTTGEEVESIGCVTIEHQPEPVQQFLINLVDNYAVEAEDGRRIAFLAVVADHPKLPKGIRAASIVGLRFKRTSADSNTVYEVVRTEGTGPSAKVHLAPIGVTHEEPRTELFSAFMTRYRPE